MLGRDGDNRALSTNRWQPPAWPGGLTRSRQRWRRLLNCELHGGFCCSSFHFLDLVLSTVFGERGGEKPFTSILYAQFMSKLHAFVKSFLNIILLAGFQAFMAALSLRSLRVRQDFPHLSCISDASLYVVCYVDSRIWTI